MCVCSGLCVWTQLLIRDMLSVRDGNEQLQASEWAEGLAKPDRGGSAPFLRISKGLSGTLILKSDLNCPGIVRILSRYLKWSLVKDEDSDKRKAVTGAVRTYGDRWWSSFPVTNLCCHHWWWLMWKMPAATAWESPAMWRSWMDRMSLRVVSHLRHLAMFTCQQSPVGDWHELWGASSS